MILVDSSIWVDHLRQGDHLLERLLERNHVLTHPFVIGEMALGNLRQRDSFLANLDQLPKTKIALDGEVRFFIDRHRLFGVGIGYVDAAILAAVQLTDGASLWSRDRRLREIADRLGLASVWVR